MPKQTVAVVKSGKRPGEYAASWPADAQPTALVITTPDGQRIELPLVCPGLAETTRTK